MSNEKILFNFTKLRFEYVLPLIHDLAFIEARRVDLKLCVELLKKRITEIDINTGTGVSDIDIASGLARYYFRAMACLDYAEKEINNGKQKDSLTSFEKHNKKWRID